MLLRIAIAALLTTISTSVSGFAMADTNYSLVSTGCLGRAVGETGEDLSNSKTRSVFDDCMRVKGYIIQTNRIEPGSTSPCSAGSQREACYSKD